MRCLSYQVIEYIRFMYCYDMNIHDYPWTSSEMCEVRTLQRLSFHTCQTCHTLHGLCTVHTIHVNVGEALLTLFYQWKIVRYSWNIRTMRVHYLRFNSTHCSRSNLNKKHFIRCNRAFFESWLATWPNKCQQMILLISLDTDLYVKVGPEIWSNATARKSVYFSL